MGRDGERGGSDVCVGYLGDGKSESISLMKGDNTGGVRERVVCAIYAETYGWV